MEGQGEWLCRGRSLCWQCWQSSWKLRFAKRNEALLSGIVLLTFRKNEVDTPGFSTASACQLTSLEKVEKGQQVARLSFDFQTLKRHTSVIGMDPGRYFPLAN